MTDAVGARKSTVGLVLRTLRGQRRRLAFIVGLSIGAGLIETGVVVLLVTIAHAIAVGNDRVAVSVGPVDTSASIAEMTAVALAALAVFLGLNVLLAVLRARTTRRWERQRRRRLVGAFLDAEFPTQVAERTGRLQAVAGSWVGSASSAIGQLITLARTSFSFVVLATAAVIADWRIALGMIGFGALMATMLRSLRARVRLHARRGAKLVAGLGEDLGEIEALAREIRLFGAEPVRLAQLDAISGRLAYEKERSQLLGAIVTPVYQTMGLVVLLLALAIAAELDGVDVTALGASALLLFRSISYGQAAQGALQSMDSLVPYIERLDEAQEAFERAAIDRTGAELVRINRIALRDVTFWYGSSPSPALDRLTMSIDRGEVVGVIGPSGSGKSTLAHILLRLRTPSSGSLEADGRAAEGFRLGDWYRQVALVPQEIPILSASVFDNIAFGRPHVTRVGAVRAAQDAAILSFITSLPDGWDTQLGRGARLISGGQAQRIGIARALADRPSLLILDEPTSALDRDAEAVIQDTIRRLRGDATIVIIAHRLTTLDVCDRIFRLEAGRLVDEGSAAEVLERLDESVVVAIDPPT